MSMLSEEQTKEILDGAIEQIKKAVIEQATQEASWTTKQAIEKRVTEIVNDFIRDEVAPEIVTSLTVRKSQIIEAAIISADQMAKILAENLTQTLSEKLGKSWERDKIFKAMFGS